VWQRPNLLVLDEPTNHLDLEMRHAMEIALQTYEGAVILVSHDRHMLRNTVDELLLVHDGLVEEYREDLDAYEKWIISSYKSPDRQSVAVTDNSRKEKRQQAAAHRDKRRPLQRLIEKTEKQMSAAESELEKMQALLSDSDLYSEARKGELADLVKREGELKVRTEELEEEWLEQQHELEELGG